MLMIMDLQGWVRMYNNSSPGSTASLCTFTFTENVLIREEKKNNVFMVFKVFLEN